MLWLLITSKIFICFRPLKDNPSKLADNQPAPHEIEDNIDKDSAGHFDKEYFVQSVHVFLLKQCVIEPLDSEPKDQVDLHENASTYEKDEQENGVDCLDDRSLHLMMEEKPASAYKWGRNLQKDKHRANSHGETLLPKREVLVGKGHDMVDECLFVDCSLDTAEKDQKESVNYQVTGREVARPNVTIAGV